MHDLNHEFDHEHQELQDFIYGQDNVELTTIGVDVGSSTFHLMFARVHLKREGEDHSSSFEIVERKVLWRSEIALTPYRGKRIDADAVRAVVMDAHLRAGLSPSQIDSGAVILTGEALRQHNARALGDAIAADSGKFVCLTAGHHLEAMLAGYGSGAVDYSKKNKVRLLHIDVGGGTTKLVYIDGGGVIATAAVMIGGRQVAMDCACHVISTSAGSSTVAKSAGVRIKHGEPFSLENQLGFVDAQVGVIIDIANEMHSSELERRLRLTRVLPRNFQPEAISFSGGVSEYIYGREPGDYGDIGRLLGEGIRRAIEGHVIHLPVVDPGNGIRATVLGASQCSVQLSGSTVSVSHPSVLPIHNVPVVHPDLGRRLAGLDFASDDVAVAIIHAIEDYGLIVTDPVALAFVWSGDPSYRRMHGLAEGIARAVGYSNSAPLVILINQDVGASIGRMIVRELPSERPVVCLDGLELSPLDFVDVGEIIQPSGALPVVIKSLLFANDRRG